MSSADHGSVVHGSGPPRVEGGAFALGGPEPSLVADCVHCGFCLPTCPTYLLWGEEMDSPRGRIYLMREGIAGMPVSDAMAGHFDACLGCMACVTACPSGVQYGTLIEQTRAELEQVRRRPARERLLRAAIFALFPYRKRLRPIAWMLAEGPRARLLQGIRRSPLMGVLPAPVRSMLEVAPTIRHAAASSDHAAASGARRGRVAVLRGCVQGAFFPAVHEATVRVLTAEGYDVYAPSAVGCCGALSEHVGRRDEAKRFARQLIDALDAEPLDAIVINAAGCGSALKEYRDLLVDDPRYASRAAGLSAKVRDVAEFLDDIEPVAPRHPLPITIAYHDACHLGHAQGVRSAPRRLLDAIPDVERVELPEWEICCGSAGVYNILQPEAAGTLGDRKASHVAGSGASLLVSANPGCTMQISAALARTKSSIATRHTVEVIDASIRGLDPGTWLAGGAE